MQRTGAKIIQVKYFLGSLDNQVLKLPCHYNVPQNHSTKELSSLDMRFTGLDTLSWEII